MADVMFYVRKLHTFAGLKLYVNLFGMMAMSVLEGAGLFLLVPMLSMIGVLNTGTSDDLSIAGFLAVPLEGVPSKLRLPVILLAFVVFTLSQARLQLKLTNLNEQIEQGFIRQLRMENYQSVLESNWSFFLKKRRSDFIHLMTNELTRISYGIYLALRLMTTILFTVVQIVIALWLSLQLTVCILICGVLLAFSSRVFIRRSRRYGSEASENSEDYFAGMTDHLGGIKDIKANMTEGPHLTWFSGLSERMAQNAIHFTRLQSVSQFYYKAAAGVLIALFVYLSIHVFHVATDRLLLIILLFSRLWPKFTGVQTNWEQLAQCIPAFRSIMELKRETEAAKELSLNDYHKNENPLRIVKGIECRNVYYRYDNDDTSYALHNINLTIPLNSMTAIVGKSGAGKSTLIDVLIGLLKPEEGTVLVDGSALRDDYDLAFRRAVSYVPQDPFLFHSTIRENLAVARGDATEEQMWEALRFSVSDEFVRKLPDGLDTVIGDRGNRLSGGERQRIVLARAILRQPSILILDEATSALDSENEALIQEALDRIKGSMTVIVIAHRLSTIRGADQVVVMDHGRIVRIGGYHQLSKEVDGVFAKLLSYQFANIS